MKKSVVVMVLTTLMTLSVGNVFADKFEIGARAGITSQNMNLTGMDVINGEAKMGWHLAAAARLRLLGLGDGLLSAGLFLQPEVVYSQSKQKGDFGNSVTEIDMKTIDVPLLLSVQLSLVRVQAGPVFSLMNNLSTVGGDLKLQTQRPVGYAVGASVDLGPLVIDARYHGDFKSSSFKGVDSWKEAKSNFSSWSVGLGLMF
jgi:hypothetical protein